MTSCVDMLSIVQLSTDIELLQSLPKNNVTIDDNDKSIDQFSDRYKQSRLIHVHHGDLIVLWFGEKNSSLRTALMEYLITEDITLILFSTEEQLWCWLNTYSSLKVASLVIQTNINIQDIVCRSSTFANIHSILIRCSTNELITLQRFSRSYVKIDGIFADDTRLLIKLVIDLALFSEEIGDQQREDEDNELNAQRNYGRARNLCTLAKRL
ncbi:unnamed protein product [Rotaria sordida]|uniref:Uncharacterized protein n=1 Tax=Rotaria sordida TaxID=392033 RepID=A0A815FPL0_9BILA|nr:unnamed protein product [Rotaria sordida]CAF1326509.1 unnamed protein product [Rotaria sordida]